MAAVLNALAPSVIKMIKDMSEEELTMLLGVSIEIKKLGGKVENLEAYLADAERRRINEARVQRWVSKLKGALYEATDILELCHLDAEERRNKGRCWASMVKKAPSCLRPMLFFLRSPGFTHGMGSRIKELNERLDGIRDEMAMFRFEPSSLAERTRPSDATPHSRTTTSLIDESAIVGDEIKRDTKDLVQVLLSNEPAIMVVSIVGPGGMGKTTLAKKIFNDEDVKMKFRSKIWLSVTESYDEEKLLCSAITQATGGGNVPLPGDKQVLSQVLVSALSSRGNRFLLVLDDVWSDGAWTYVLREPIVEAARQHPGSRVIITTRNEQLVKDMEGAAAYRQHHVRPMNYEDAWSLLKKQLPPQDVGSEEGLDNLKYIGMGIISNCGGLPLAIKAIGGLLRTKRATKLEWNGVLDDPAWKTDNAHHDLNIALQLSYEDLPPAMKQCFLYYSFIPKGLNLNRNTIIGMWMSEGFLLVPDDYEEHDVGVSYYTSLIRRNLIEPLGTSVDENMSMMHDVIRSFAQFMAKEEARVIRAGQEISTHLMSSSTKYRRLSIESTELEPAVLPAVLPDWSCISENQDLLRSLIIYGRMKFEPSTSTDSSLRNRLPSLRMLFVINAESDRFVKESLAKLKHIRYLYLERTDISRLPDDIYKMRFLEYIRIQSCASFSGELPSSIIKLERLRSLIIGPDTIFSVPKGFGGLTNLRKLTIPVQTDGEWCSLQELGSLSRLTTLLIEGLEAMVPCGGSSAAAKAKLHEKQQLRDLELACNNPREEENNSDAVVQRVEEVFDQLRPPCHLETLIFENYLGRRGPSWLTAVAVDLNSLTHLQMTGLPFCTQLPDGLCQLPSLEFLMIDYAPSISLVGPEFVNQRWRQMMASFPRLQFLRFKGLPNWEEWAWEAKDDDIIAMPSLQDLLIADCKLERLPAGLASSKRIALRELSLVTADSITAVENFPSVEKLNVWNCPSLKIIRGFPRLQVASISYCPALEVLEDVPALDTMELVDPAMKTFPEYLRGLKARHLWVFCHQSLHDLLSCNTDNNPSSDYLAEAEKVKHCGKVTVGLAASHAATIQGRQTIQVVPSINTIFGSMHQGTSLDFNEGLASAMRDYVSKGSN